MSDLINAINYLLARVDEGQPKRREENWMDEFRSFYDKNDRGGADRWCVPPWMVREFIKKQLKAAKKTNKS